MTKAQSNIVGVLFMIGLVVAGAQKLFESFGATSIGIFCVSAVALIIIIQVMKYQKRKMYLLKKYNDAPLVEKLMSRSYWVTAEVVTVLVFALQSRMGLLLVGSKRLLSAIATTS